MRNLTKYFNICLKEVKDAGIVPGHIVECVPNSRAKSRWGQCCYRPDGCHLNINSTLLDEKHSTELGLKQTIIHEILHTCEGCDSHTGQWLKYAKLMNKLYGYNIKRGNTCSEIGVDSTWYYKKKSASKATAKYVLYCEKCHAKIARTRKTVVIEHPERYRCSCGGKLKVLHCPTSLAG